MIVSDVAPPTTRTLSLISDPRALQYWDRQHALSDALLKSARRPGSQDLDAAESSGVTIVWDFVALYPAGERWDEDLPHPIYHGDPIAPQMDGLRRRLALGPGFEGR